MLTRHGLFAMFVGGLLSVGCASTPPVAVASFPSERDVLPTVEARTLLARARADFELVRRRKPPRYAQLQYALRDGGTTVYQGQGYSLTAHKRIVGTRDGRAQYRQGPAIGLTKPIVNHPVSYSEVRDP